MEEALRLGGAVRTISGRTRFLPGLLLGEVQMDGSWGPVPRGPDKWAFLSDYRRLLNTPIQGSAADLMVEAMLACNTYQHPRLVKLGHVNWTLVELAATMLAQIHDELVFRVPAENAEAARDEIKERMENAMKLSIPTTVDIHIVDHWGQAK